MGELLALMTALLWAMGVVLYKKSVTFVPPFALSVFKAVVALVLMVATAFAVGQTFSVRVSPGHLFIILFSGALGIGVSDTLYFMTLSRIGASRTALVDCLYSPVVILFSALMLDERLSRFAVAGGVLILSSVLISWNKGFEKKISSKQLWTGCALGAGAMCTVGFAIVLVKPVLPLYPLVWVSTLRMAGGLVALVVLLPLHPDRRAVLETFRPHSGWAWMLLGTFFGSYLSLMCWLAGFKYAQAGIAALLNQTSTVLIVLLAAIVLKEPLTRVKLLAVGMAFAGAAMVLLSQTYAGKQILKSASAAQRIQSGMDLQPHHFVVPPAVCALEPVQRQVSFSELSVNHAECVWRRAGLFCDFIQINKQPVPE